MLFNAGQFVLCPVSVRHYIVVGAWTNWDAGHDRRLAPDDSIVILHYSAEFGPLWKTGHPSGDWVNAQHVLQH